MTLPEALRRSVAHPDTVFMTTDTHGIVMNGVEYGRGTGLTEEQTAAIGVPLYTDLAIDTASGTLTGTQEQFLSAREALLAGGRLAFIHHVDGSADNYIPCVADNPSDYVRLVFTLCGYEYTAVIGSDGSCGCTRVRYATESDLEAAEARLAAADEAFATKEALGEVDGKVQILSDYHEDVLAYGIEFDTTISTPACTRIGSPLLHKKCPVQSGMRGCLLDDAGHVVRYLNPTDWTAETRDGSEGQVMVEIPRHYRKFEEDGTKRRVWLSELPLTGYTEVPLSYISAYEAAVERATNKLASVVNATAAYRGGDNNAEWDDTYRSLLGRPATSISRTNFRKYARNRKAGSTQWNCLTYDIYKTVFWLFVVEYATLNSQAAVNGALTADGYHQGGLGSGATNLQLTPWTEFNGYGPYLPCGYTDALGNGTGETGYAMPVAYSVANTTVMANRYRGIENPFGHLHKWTDGVNILISADVEKGGDGTSRVYVQSDPSLFSDTSNDTYTYIGEESRPQGFTKEIIFGSGGDIVPKVCSGASSTTYFCDNHYTSYPNSGSSLRGLLFGGTSNYGSIGGLACAYSGYVPANANAYIGSRLCFQPHA